MLLLLAAEVVLAEDVDAAHAANAEATAGVDDHVDDDVDAARSAPDGTDTEFGVAVDDFSLHSGFFPVSNQEISIFPRNVYIRHLGQLSPPPDAKEKDINHSFSWVFSHKPVPDGYLDG